MGLKSSCRLEDWVGGWSRRGTKYSMYEVCTKYVSKESRQRWRRARREFAERGLSLFGRPQDGWKEQVLRAVVCFFLGE